MTDDEMDARLHRAGAAWRAAEDVPAATTSAEPATLAAPAPPTRPRRHRLALLATAAVVAAALAVGGVFALRGTGDGNRGTDSATALVGTVWRLLGYGGDQPRSDSTATLYIGQDGNLVADDSCNVVTAKADPSGGRLRVSQVDARYYNCTDAAGEVTFDTAIDMFPHTLRWTVAGHRLTISAPGGAVMHLAAAPDLLPPTADRPTLTGATWKLRKVVDAHGAEVPLRGPATLRIDRGTFRGSDTCNTMSGRAALTGNQLTVTSLATTEMACPDAMDSAAVVDAVFTGTAELTAVGATLTVTREGAGTLTYSWQPDDEQATDPKRLTATGWRLRLPAGAPRRDEVLLNLTAPGLVTVAGNCASINGDATVGVGTLTTSSLPKATPKGCSDKVSTLLSFLTSPPTLWSIQEHRLLVYGGNAQAFALVFDPMTPVTAAAVELTGRTWKLQSITVEDGNTSSGSGSSDTGVTLTLTESTYRARTPCGEQAGPVTLGDRTIDFPHPILGACNRGALARVAEVFDGTVAWSISNGQLTLKKGKVTLTFSS